MQITEQFILLQAPNQAAVENGRKLSKKGSFSNHQRTEDSLLYWADCTGSGKTPYHTSIDFGLDQSAPTCRCSCPSRQFPCKHALGLMFEILSAKTFKTAEIPQDIADKRAKQLARAAKERDKENAPAEAAPADKPKKTNTSAQKKKLQKQLEGLDIVQKMVDELLSSGLGTLAGTSAQSFESLAKELGNYYLTGPQTSLLRIALTVREIQQSPEKADRLYTEALRILIALHTTLKKSREFLNTKLESSNFSAEDSVLYEALGGTWKLSDLHAIGSFRENARLVQLSFDVSLDAAKQEYVERGFWIDIDRGVIDQTLNLRPLKALQYVKADDSCFELMEIPLLYQYPGEYNRRIRWEGFTTRPISEEEYALLPTLAKSGIVENVKLAKGQMKNTLLPKYLPVLLPISSISQIGGQPVLIDPRGSRILLRDRHEDGANHAACHRLRMLPVSEFASSAMFGLMFYDEADHRICLHPYSIVTGQDIIRLLY